MNFSRASLSVLRSSDFGFTQVKPRPVHQLRGARTGVFDVARRRIVSRTLVVSRGGCSRNRSWRSLSHFRPGLPSRSGYAARPTGARRLLRNSRSQARIVSGPGNRNSAIDPRLLPLSGNRSTFVRRGKNPNLAPAHHIPQPAPFPCGGEASVSRLHVIPHSFDILVCAKNRGGGGATNPVKENVRIEVTSHKALEKKRWCIPSGQNADFVCAMKNVPVSTGGNTATTRFWCAWTKPRGNSRGRPGYRGQGVRQSMPVNTGATAPPTCSWIMPRHSASAMPG